MTIFRGFGPSRLMSTSSSEEIEERKDLCDYASGSSSTQNREEVSGKFVRAEKKRPRSSLISSKRREEDESIAPKRSCLSGHRYRTLLTRNAHETENFGMRYAEPEGSETNCLQQAEENHDVCVICKHPGPQLHCGGKGCKNGYHLSCLDPPLPLSDLPVGLWLCFCCLRKKMEFGVYSVSEGIESVWDLKEEMQEKHYFVKYKGLAHAYNCWISESLLLTKDPMLLARFKKHHKEQVKMWKCEWMEPHHLLQKRFLVPWEHGTECSCGHSNNFEYCYTEWLVKWKGLGYELATWEFENSPVLCSDEGKTLISDYERHREETKKVSDPSRAKKIKCLKEDPQLKLLSLPDGCPSKLDNDHLDSISNILRCWGKNQNAVLIDDQERIVISILFLLHLALYACRPFLIISSVSSLSTWEDEFTRMAPSISVVVYNGNKIVRKMIQAHEFYDGDGRIMFKVLLVCPNIITEDLESFDCIDWEAIIIDDCQKSGVSKHFETFINLSTEFRLLLLRSPPMDNPVDYINLLSFVDSRGQENPVNSLKLDSFNSSEKLSILKERLKQYIVYECKRNSSIFLEYWVPVQLSELQLIEYCSILVSNTCSLRSRADYVESLLDILISVRKCCDHPYLANDSLQRSMTQTKPGTEILDIGVNASGKLQLLDKILREMKNRGRRVLILFQSNAGSGRNHMGDILYDFLHQRFGDASFVYVDSRLGKSQTQPILQGFNDTLKEEKFVIVIESRACRPRIKLSLVDAVVIYDSDWNPLNDLKALQKISIDSPVQPVKVFRLYSPYTVEERILHLTKEDGGLEVDIENTSTKLRHSLLSWGASFLFGELNKLHQSDGSTARPKPFVDNSLLNDILNLLTQSREDINAMGARSFSNIAEASLKGAFYSSNISLFGEREDLSSFDEDPTLFWSKLFETCSPKLRHTSGPSPRIRRSIQYPDESPKRPERESYDLKKVKKLGRGISDSISQQCRGWEIKGLEETAVPEHTSPCHAAATQGAPKCLPSSTATSTDHEELEEGEIRERPKSNIQSCLEPASKESRSRQDDSLKEKTIDLIERVYSARLGELLIKQSQEAMEFKNLLNQEKDKLMKSHGLEDICTSKHDMEELSKKMDRHMKGQRTKLSVMQITARNKEKQIKDQWLEEAKKGMLPKTFDTLPLSATGFKLEKFKFIGQAEPQDESRDALNRSGSSSDAAARSNTVLEMVPNDGMKPLPSKKEKSVCNLKNLIPGEPAEQKRISFQRDTSSEAAVGSNEAYSENQPFVPREEIDATLTEKESPACQPKSVPAVEFAEPSRSSDIAETCVCLETKAFDSQSKIMDVIGDDLDGVDEVSGKSIEHHRGAESSGACLTSNFQCQPYIAALPHASCNQVAPVSKLEIPAVAEPGCDNSSEQIQVEHSNHVPEASDHVMSGHQREHAHIGSVQKPRNQVHGSAKFNGMSTAATSVATSVEIRRSDNLLSDCLALQPPSGFSRLPENTQQHLRNINVQPMPQQGPHLEPFLNEMCRLRDEEHSIAQNSEEQKRHLELKFEKELEEVRKKYASKIQKVETQSDEKMKDIKRKQKLVHMNRKLAAEFRRNFIAINRGTTAGSKRSMQQAHLLHVPRPEIAQRPILAPPPFTPAPTPKSPSRSSSVMRPTLSSTVNSMPVFGPSHNNSPESSNNLIRAHGSPVLEANANLHAISYEPRAPAPHLRPFRSQPTTSLQNRQFI